MTEIPQEAIDAVIRAGREHCKCDQAYHEYDCTLQLDAETVQPLLTAAAPHLAPAPVPVDPAMAHCGQCAHRLGAGCGEPCCAWAGEAVLAAAGAIWDVLTDGPPLTDKGQRCNQLARQAVQAALPVIAAAVAAGERERCAALAEQRNAQYIGPGPFGTGKYMPFADLLRAGPGLAHTTGDGRG